MSQKTKMELIEQAKVLFSRGLRMSKELLSKEEVEMDSLIELEDKLQNTVYAGILNDYKEKNSEHLKASEEFHFIQGYLAAKGFDEGIQPIRSKSRRVSRQIIYVDEIEEGVIIATKDTLFVGTSA